MAHHPDRPSFYITCADGAAPIDYDSAARAEAVRAELDETNPPCGPHAVEARFPAPRAPKQRRIRSRRAGDFDAHDVAVAMQEDYR